MKMPSPCVLPLLLALAGCRSDDPPANVVENKVEKVELPAGPMLGPIDLSKPADAAGERPFWRMGLAPGRITFADTPGGQPADYYPVTPAVSGDRATFVTQTPEGAPVTVTLVLEPCGAEKRPLTAEVAIGGRRLRGCAAPR